MRILPKCLPLECRTVVANRKTNEYLWLKVRTMQVLAVPQNVKLSFGLAFTPKYIPKRIANRCSNKFMYMNIHSSTLCNSPKVEKPRCPSKQE